MSAEIVQPNHQRVVGELVQQGAQVQPFVGVPLLLAQLIQFVAQPEQFYLGFGRTLRPLCLHAFGP